MGPKLALRAPPEGSSGRLGRPGAGLTDMRITFKLYASLTQHLPVDARQSNRVELDIAEGTPISKIIGPFGMPEKLVHLVLINGVYVPPEERLSFTPKEGDVLAIWPPIAGG